MLMPIIQLGFKPIPIDINKENLNIKEDLIYNLKNCKVLFITNALGFCSDLKIIKKICKKKKLFLLKIMLKHLALLIQAIN